MSLNPKQQRFCEEYVVDFNATRAAVDAGYSPKTARSQGQRLLTNVDVAARVAEFRDAIAERTRVTADKVRREFARVAFANTRDFVEWGPGGVKLKESSELSEDDSAAVNEVSISYSENGKTVKFKLSDKMAALKTLAVHTGLVEKESRGGVNVSVSVDNREQRMDYADVPYEKLEEYERMFEELAESAPDPGGDRRSPFPNPN